MEFILLFLVAILLDLLIGDPQWYPHPVRLIGRLCEFCEKRSRKIFPDRAALAGLLSVITVLSVTGVVIWGILLFAHSFSRELELFFGVILLYTTIAIRDLLAHSHRVYRALRKKNNLRMARRQVSMIVGRETASLEEADVVRACVETVAENFADGIIAPFFWAMVVVVIDGVVPSMGAEGLAPLSWAVIGAFLYKASNTMDSIYGYKNARYIDFGSHAARLDDLLNYLPARIAGVYLVIAAPLLGLHGGRALKMVLRDSARHVSPNAGYPESAMAGALGVQLGGPTKYFNKLVDKATLGDATRELEPADILRANWLVSCSSALFILSYLLFYAVFSVFF